MTRIRWAAVGVLSILTLIAVGRWAGAEGGEKMKFKRVSVQFIAALGDPGASSGSGAQSWGIWRVDPGPRGVRLENYEKLAATGGVTPAKWVFDASDFWVEEHGLIMEKPEFPLPPGKYMVTGDREVTTVLTIYPADASGDRRWELANGAKLYDVTHLPCRSARYTLAAGATCSPAQAQRSDFPVKPGAAMPAISGCSKQDYSVLFIVGVAEE